MSLVILESFPRSRLKALLDHFGEIDEPREPWRVAHPLPEVLLLVVCGTIGDCEDYDEIAEWGDTHLDVLRRYAPYHHGVPSGRRRAALESRVAKARRRMGTDNHRSSSAPGTSKWNKIEHRLFSFISRIWRGRPLTDDRTIVELIGATTAMAGLTVRCQLDENSYPAGIKVSDADMAKLNIQRNDFHGEWNYTIIPTPSKSGR